MLISVIVPIYNMEEYLVRCIESVIHQTYYELEIILINDGSKDSSLRICREYEKKDRRIIVIDKENGGLSDARNSGIEVASGRYLLFVDSDDYLHPQMIEGLVTVAHRYDADIAICDYLRVNNDVVPDNKKYQECDFLRSVDTYSGLSALGKVFEGKRHVAFTVAWNKLYKNELFCNIRFPVGRIHEDEAVAYKLMHLSNRIIFVNIAMYYYVQRDGSIMKSAFSVKKFDFILAYRERMEYMVQNSMFEKEAVKLYLWKYMDILQEYKKFKPEEHADYVLRRRQLKKDYHLFKRYLPFGVRIKCIVRMYFLGFYTRLHDRLKIVNSK